MKTDDNMHMGTKIKIKIEFKNNFVSKNNAE